MPGHVPATPRCRYKAAGTSGPQIPPGLLLPGTIMQCQEVPSRPSPPQMDAQTLDPLFPAFHVPLVLVVAVPEAKVRPPAGPSCITGAVEKSTFSASPFPTQSFIFFEKTTTQQQQQKLNSAFSYFGCFYILFYNSLSNTFLMFQRHLLLPVGMEKHCFFLFSLFFFFLICLCYGKYPQIADALTVPLS